MNQRDAAISDRAQAAMLLAEFYALKRTVEGGLRSLGLQDIDGLSFSDFFDRQYAQQLERVLLAVGDKNPDVAEEIQRRIESLMKKPSA